MLVFVTGWRIDTVRSLVINDGNEVAFIVIRVLTAHPVGVVKPFHKSAGSSIGPGKRRRGPIQTQGSDAAAIIVGNLRILNILGIICQPITGSASAGIDMFAHSIGRAVRCQAFRFELSVYIICHQAHTGGIDEPGDLAQMIVDDCLPRRAIGEGNARQQAPFDIVCAGFDDASGVGLSRGLVESIVGLVDMRTVGEGFKRFEASSVVIGPRRRIAIGTVRRIRRDIPVGGTVGGERHHTAGVVVGERGWLDRRSPFRYFAAEKVIAVVHCVA